MSGFSLLGLFGFTSLKHFLFPLCAGVLLLLLLLKLASLALGCLEPGLLEELIQEVVLLVLAALSAFPVAALGWGHAVPVRVVRGVRATAMTAVEWNRRRLLDNRSARLVDRW